MYMQTHTHVHAPITYMCQQTHSHTDILMPDMMAHPSNLSSPEVAVGGSVVLSQVHSQFGDNQKYMIAFFKKRLLQKKNDQDIAYLYS